MGWHKVMTVGDLASEEARSVSIRGEDIAVFNLEGEFFATQDRCPHAQASLSEGIVDDNCIECPLHQANFHIPTGACQGGPVDVDLRVYPCRIENGEVFVELREDARAG